jgi:hypothetical protein
MTQRRSQPEQAVDHAGRSQFVLRGGSCHHSTTLIVSHRPDHPIALISNEQNIRQYWLHLP